MNHESKESTPDPSNDRGTARSSCTRNRERGKLWPMFRAAVIALLALGLVCPSAARATPPTAAFAKAKAKKKPPRTLTLKELSRRIDKLMADPLLQRGFWGIEVVDADSGQPVYERNSDRLFTPASNTKLFTTATALALLGPDFTVETTVETDGALDAQGKLTGDLLLVGRGDPNLSGRVSPYAQQTERVLPHLRVLEQLADSVVAAGVKEITGEIVGDDSLFAFERYGAGWGQDDLMWSDGAPASALTVNDNVIFLSLTPGEVGAPARVTVDPDVSYYTIDNRVTTTAPHTGTREIGMNREPGSKRLTIWGSLPADDTGWTQAIAIDDPAEYAALAFREMLTKRGVVVHGEPRAAHLFTSELPLYALDVKTAGEHAEHGGGASPAPAVSYPTRKVLARLTSRPLRDDIVVINKVSQNLHAELALRQVGKERGTSASLESALAAEQAFLLSIGLEEGSFHLYDGSGMSFHDLVSPRAVTTLLRWTQTQPWGELYRESLPVAGLDGSLNDRFRETVARTRVWAKTGTLTDVHCLSGFAETESGRRFVFSVLVNHHGMTGSAAKKVIDHLVELLVDDQTGRFTGDSTGSAAAH